MWINGTKHFQKQESGKWQSVAWRQGLVRAVRNFHRKSRLSGKIRSNGLADQIQGLLNRI